MRPLTLAAAVTLAGCTTPAGDTWRPDPVPHGAWLVVLGTGQDGGVPQTGDWDHPGWIDPHNRRLVSSIAVADPADGTTLLFDATPDLPEQLRRLYALGVQDLPDVFLTHAHMGHYTGLMHIGHEGMGAQGVPVHAMPRMAGYLSTSGPWSQLVDYGNIRLRPLVADSVVTVGAFSVTPLPVPHRPEFSEAVGFRIQGPRKRALFIPDIDSWVKWDSLGVHIEDLISDVDYAFLDGSFFADGEVPGRDMSGFPHPRISETMERFAPLPETERAKVWFIHLNHTNPAHWSGPETDRVHDSGFNLAREGLILEM